MRAVPFVFTALVFSSCSLGICQENSRPHLNHTESPRLYFSIPPTDNSGPVELIASSAERDLTYPLSLSSADTRATLELRGNVVVRICTPGSHGCDHGSFVVKADAVDYNEKTGEMDVHGNVHIGRYQKGTAPGTR